MRSETKELSAGITFTSVPLDAFKMARLTIFFTIPLTDESAASRFSLLPLVLRQGTKSYPTATAIARRQEELYSADLSSSVFKSGDNQVISFSVEFLRREFLPDDADLMSDAVALLNEVVFEPLTDKDSGVFRDEYVEREKKNACDAIRSIQNNKARLALERTVSLACAKDPYGISAMGTVEETEQITPASLFAAYRALLAEANIHIYYTGVAHAADILALFMPYITRIRRHPRLLAPTRTIRKAKKKKVKERTLAAQSRLCIAFCSGTDFTEKELAPLLFFYMIYGVSPTSKLFANVREKLSLCYSCSLYPISSKALFVVSAGIESAKKRRATREILYQLARMRAGKISENEMKMALKALVSQRRALYDSPSAIERRHFTYSLAGLSLTPEEEIALLKTVTVRDVVRIAKRVTVDTVYFLRGDTATAEEGEDFDE